MVEQRRRRIVRELNQDSWRKFVDGNPRGNIFHTPQMFDVFARTRGFSPALWAAVGDDDEILALLMPVQITVLDGLLRPLTTRAVAHGSVLCAPGAAAQEALAVLLEAYKREQKGRALFTELRNLSSLGDLQPVLRKYDFDYEEHLNFLIDLNRPPTEIWQSIRSNARRNIQKARKSEVLIEEVTQLQQISAAYELLKDVYKRIQVPLPDISLFQSAFQLLGPEGMLKILIAKVKEVDVGVLTLLLYKKTVYYWFTGTLREYASYRPGDLLVWHALELGNQIGFCEFDFGGGGRPEQEYGVRDFKAKFGGELVNYGRNVCIHAPLRLKISQAGYRLVRGFL